MLSKASQFSFLIILIILYACNVENISPTKNFEQLKIEEVGLDYEVTESGVNVTVPSKELETKLKNYFKLDKIIREEYPILLTRMFLEEYLGKSSVKESHNGRVNQDNDQIFCLAQITMNSTTYSSFSFGIYSDVLVNTSRNLRDHNIPIGTYIESYVVQFPVGQQNGIILNQSLYTVSTDITCTDGDELAAAKAQWLNQHATTSSKFLCDD